MREAPQGMIAHERVEPIRLGGAFWNSLAKSLIHTTSFKSRGDLPPDASLGIHHVGEDQRPQPQPDSSPEKRSSHSTVEEATGLAMPSLASFLAALGHHPLFQKSILERWVALSLFPLTRLFSFRVAPVHSQVVPQLTLWERFLCHRQRRVRQMTFAVSFQDLRCQHADFVHRATVSLCRFIHASAKGWENQPLLILIEDCCRTRRLDPRVSAGNCLRVAIARAQGDDVVFTLDMPHAAGLPAEELDDYVARQIAAARPSREPVSVIVNEHSASFEELQGEYAARPGAWLRIAADRDTGGLVASADHLVLDGAMFQQMLISVARESSIPANNDPPASSSGEARAVVDLQLDESFSICELLYHMTNTLQDAGLNLHSGRESVLLATIPRTRPLQDESVPHSHHRALPLLLTVEAADGPEQLRAKISELNENGWKSIGAYTLSMVYRGCVCGWVIRYIERISPFVPFQSTARYLVGGALLTVLPPVNIAGEDAARIQGLSVRTLNPLCGGPTIAVSQVRDSLQATPRYFISISGSRQWDCPERLRAIRDALALRLKTAKAAGPPQNAPLPAKQNQHRPHASTTGLAWLPKEPAS
ncbi:MAG: hypothetical protein KDA76_06610 [Planctomycetaceae bacterium]|nr:hypothetical protein [Planctomycetaceae bacterium]